MAQPPAARRGPGAETRPDVVIRPIPTLILGGVAGLMVGLTSVGAGSIVVVVLLMLYPRLKASALVGTDLTQAIPLVAAAALGHILFGSFSLAIASSLLVGAIPGTYIGAHVSSRAPGGIIRRVLAVVLLASSLKLLGVPDAAVLAAALAALVFAFVLWRLIRDRIKRIPAGATPRSVVPDLGALPLPRTTPPRARRRPSMTSPGAGRRRRPLAGAPGVLDDDGLDRLELVLGGWLPPRRSPRRRRASSWS